MTQKPSLFLEWSSFFRPSYEFEYLATFSFDVLMSDSQCCIQRMFFSTKPSVKLQSLNNYCWHTNLVLTYLIEYYVLIKERMKNG